MIIKLYPQQIDLENIAKFDLSHPSKDYNYSNVVVNKPWGYEYMWLQTANVAIWILYIAPEKATSLHCHWRKRTSLIVLDGEVTCSTLKSQYNFQKLEAVVIEPCLFHSTKAISPKGAFIMEIEAPSYMKSDLLRLQDNFGREKQKYEGENFFSQDISMYEYLPLINNFNQALIKEKFKTVALHIFELEDIASQQYSLTEQSLIIPLQRIINPDNFDILVDVGEACQVDIFKQHIDLLYHQNALVVNRTKILEISNLGDS